MRLKSLAILLIAVFSYGISYAQSFNTNGQWNVGSNWSTGSVPSGTGTDVTIAANVTVSGGNYTIGNVNQVNNNTTITVDAGSNLTTGSSTLYNPPSATTKKSMTFANAGTLTVAGTLYIYGDLIVSNTLTFNITGSVIVYGNITMSNGGDIAVSGSGTLQVIGSLNGGNGTHLSTSGGATVSVGGGINLGGGNSSISGPPGSISSPGGCTCTGNGSGCNTNGAGGCGSAVTPIELLYFIGETQPGKVMLKWATATELNFDHFSIQRSSEGMSFSEIGTVEGHGTTNEVHKYSFADTNPLIGRSYYKLTAIDFDGYSESFKIVTVNTKGGKQASVYPNPVVDSQLFVDFNFSSEKESRAIITDLTGTQLAQFKLSSTSNVLYLNLNPGTYVIMISSDEFSSVARFMVK